MRSRFQCEPAGMERSGPSSTLRQPLASLVGAQAVDVAAQPRAMPAVTHVIARVTHASGGDAA